MYKPEIYDAWYQTAKGRWIGQQEFLTLLKLFTTKEGQTLLDVGSGTGYFSERFQQAGLQVAGLEPEQALAEMWRVSRKAVILGLLNRQSLLYYMKRNSSGYQGARWDKLENVRQWANQLRPAAKQDF